MDRYYKLLSTYEELKSGYVPTESANVNTKTLDALNILELKLQQLNEAILTSNDSQTKELILLIRILLDGLALIGDED